VARPPVRHEAIVGIAEHGNSAVLVTVSPRGVRTPDPQRMQNKILEAGLPQVHHPATTTFYFAAPGGQVIGIRGTDPEALSNELKSSR